MNRTTVKKAHRKFAHNDNKCWQSRIKYKYEKRWNFFFVEFVNGHMMFYTIYWSITIKFRQMCSDLWLPKWWSSRQPIHFTAVSSFCMFLALSICRVVQISVFFCLAVYFLGNQCCLLFFPSYGPYHLNFFDTVYQLNTNRPLYTANRRWSHVHATTKIIHRARIEWWIKLCKKRNNGCCGHRSNSIMYL